MSDAELEVEAEVEDDDNETGHETLARPIRFGEVGRKEWGALDSRAKSELWTPVMKILLLYGTQTKECTNKKDCIKIIRDLQVVNMFHKRMPDINYNFMIGGDGNVYEGRGFHIKVTMRSDFPPNSLVIGFIGDYSMEEPPQIMFDTTDAFIQRYVKEGKINPNWRKNYIIGY